MPVVSPTLSLPVRFPAVVRLGMTAILVALLGVTIAKYVNKAEKPSRLGDNTRTAFLRWRAQLHDLTQGVDVYKIHRYPNPPIMALVLLPFANLPPLVGAISWLVLKAILAVVSTVWVIRLIQGTGPPIPDSALFVAIALSIHPILGDLNHGNVNIFIGFLVFAALELFRKRYDTASGLVLALAIACKVTPALFIPYLVWKRSWRALIGVTLGLALWLLVVPGVALGWDHNQTLLNSWFQEMVRPFAIDGKVTSEHANQSLPGVVFRLMTNEPSFLVYGDDGNGPPEAAAYHNLVDVGNGTAKAIVKGAMVAFALAVVLWCRWPTGLPNVPRVGIALAAEYSLFVLGMLLFSERTWKHHAVTLILPTLLLASVMVTPTVSIVFRRFCMATLGIVAGLMFIPSILGGDAQDTAMVYGTHFFAFVFLTGGVLAVLIHANRAPQPAVA